MKKIICLLAIALALAGCYPETMVTHSPVIAKSSEQVTFSAEVKADGEGPCTVEIYVNSALVQTCPGFFTGDTCTYTGGPYNAYEGSTVSYRAVATDSEGNTDTKGDYSFAITDSNYEWSRNFIPARVAGSHCAKEDLVFHQASDYSSFDDFIDDAQDKMYDIYAGQEIIEDPDNFDAFNFYVYNKTAGTGGCGTVHSDAATDMPWRDADAILHTADFGDCTIGSHFTAEGQNTKAFLHESGHGVYGLADEYDDWDCSTYYFQPANEPNIWSTEAECRAEQTDKGRDPDECYQFTSCDGGWWGIHDMSANTVMQRGMVNDPWGTEAEEHLSWFYDTTAYADLCLEGVVVLLLTFNDEDWLIGPDEVRVLPCPGPSALAGGAENDPLIRVLGSKNEVIQEYHIRNPRVMLIEDPSEQPWLLEKGSFDLRFGLVEGMETLEFWYDPLKQQQPTLSVDLRDAIREYWAKGGPEQEASCQDPQEVQGKY
jgi:hypothetical protein